MRKEKDFTYYGKKRFKVQRILRMLEKGNKHDYSLLYCGICLVLIALCLNLENIFKVDLGILGGVLTSIFIFEFVWCLGNTILFIVCGYLDKYYLKKRVEAFNKYIEDEKCSRT